MRDSTEHPVEVQKAWRQLTGYSLVLYFAPDRAGALRGNQYILCFYLVRALFTE